jgi:group I intron endonuclease
MPKVCGIYAIIRIDSGDCYVGQSLNIANRWSLHRIALRKGRHDNRHLQAAVTKYGFESFEFKILESGFDPSNRPALTAAEQKWIDALNPRYNIARVAGTSRGVKHTEEFKRAKAEALRGNTWNIGRTPWHAGKRWSPEVIAKISATKKGCEGPRKGIPRTDEVKRKISLKKTGVPSGRLGQPSPLRGVPWSEERRLAKKGVPWSEGRRQAYLRSKYLRSQAGEAQSCPL